MKFMESFKSAVSKSKKSITLGLAGMAIGIISGKIQDAKQEMVIDAIVDKKLTDKFAELANDISESEVK